MFQTSIEEILNRSQKPKTKIFCKYCRGVLQSTKGVQFWNQAHPDCLQAMKNYERESAIAKLLNS